MTKLEEIRNKVRSCKAWPGRRYSPVDLEETEYLLALVDEAEAIIDWVLNNPVDCNTRAEIIAMMPVPERKEGC